MIMRSPSLPLEAAWLKPPPTAPAKALAQAHGGGERVRRPCHRAQSPMDLSDGALGLGSLVSAHAPKAGDSGRGERMLDLAQVAGLHHAGAHQGNIHRDLLRCYVPQWATPHPHTVLGETIVRNGDGESMAVTEQAALLPSDWVRVLHERGLADDLLGTRQQREAFWASQADSPKMCGVGYYHLDFEPGDTVPLLLFSDGARHAEQDSITTASFRSLLAHDLDVAQSMFMLCAVPKSATVKHKTWEAIWQVLTADLNCLAQGRVAWMGNRRR